MTISCYRAHMQDLQEVTQDVHYENFRLERLAQGNGEKSSLKPGWVPPSLGRVLIYLNLQMLENRRQVSILREAFEG